METRQRDTLDERGTFESTSDSKEDQGWRFASCTGGTSEGVMTCECDYDCFLTVP